MILEYCCVAFLNPEDKLGGVRGRIKFPIAGLCLFLLSSCGRDELHLVDEIRFRVDFGKQMLTAEFDLSGDLGNFNIHPMSFDNLGEVRLVDRGEQDLIQIDIALSTAVRGLSWPAKDYRSLLNHDDLPKRFRDETLSRWSHSNETSEIGLIFNHGDKLQFGFEWSGEIFSRLYKNYVGVQELKDRGDTKYTTLVMMGPTANSPGGITILCDFGESPFDQKIEEVHEWVLKPIRENSSSWDWIPKSWLRSALLDLSRASF